MYRAMVGAHNTFIQGINSMIIHAPTVTPENVKPFTFFCLSVVCASLLLIIMTVY